MFPRIALQSLRVDLRRHHIQPPSALGILDKSCKTTQPGLFSFGPRYPEAGKSLVARRLVRDKLPSFGVLHILLFIDCGLMRAFLFGVVNSCSLRFTLFVSLKSVSLHVAGVYLRAS